MILFPIFALAECTGMRPGELRGLEWRAFNKDNKTIRIFQAVTYGYEDIGDIQKKAKGIEYISVTKTKYGRRTLKLSDLAVSTLIEWRNYLDACNNEAMKNSPFIFPNETGSFRSETSMNTMIRRFKKSRGLENMNIYLYRFRHSVCTRLILAGKPISAIQRIMGDNTTDVIMKIYTHVTEQQALEVCQDFYEDMNERHLELEV